MVSEVTKRDGKKEVFVPQKIYSVIFKAAEDIYPSPRKVNAITQDAFTQALAVLSKHPDSSIGVETIQDIVEESLKTLGYNNVAKAYLNILISKGNSKDV